MLGFDWFWVMCKMAFWVGFGVFRVWDWGLPVGLGLPIDLLFLILWLLGFLCVWCWYYAAVLVVGLDFCMRVLLSWGWCNTVFWGWLDWLVGF